MIDDGSTDDTLNVARSYESSDERVRVFTQPNAGVSSARNHGIREARGEYLYFLDSDDWIEDDALEVLLDAQASYPDKLITSRIRYLRINDDGNLITVNFSRYITDNIMNLEQAAASFSGALHGNINSSCFKLLRSDVIHNKNISFIDGIAHNEDGLFIFEYLQNTAGVFHLNRVLNNILARAESSSRSEYSSKMLNDTLKVYSIMQSYPSITPEMRNIITINRFYYLFCVLFKSIEDKAELVDIRFIKGQIRPSMHKAICCGQFSVRIIVKIFIAMCMPVPLVRSLFSLWKVLKSMLRRT